MSNSKRKLLKSLGVAGIAGAGLPATWTRPVVQSVVLPLHAQTTAESLVLSLEAYSASCEDESTQRLWFYHWVDDSGLYPVLISQADEPAHSNYFYRSYVNTKDTQVRYYLTEYPAEITYAANCFCGSQPFTYDGPYSFPLLSVPGGKPWQVYYEAAIDDEGVTTSEITVTKG